MFVHVTAMCLSLCITLIHIHGEFLDTSKNANKVSCFLPTRFFHKPFKTLCVLSESRSDTRMKETTFSFSLTGSFLAYECTLHLAPPILKSDWLSTVPISALIGQPCLSNWTVRTITRALKWLFFVTASKKLSEFHVL